MTNNIWQDKRKMRQDRHHNTHNNRQQKLKQIEKKYQTKDMGKTAATTQRQGEHKINKDKEKDESNNAKVRAKN
jgi:hypothetical protein